MAPDAGTSPEQRTGQTQPLPEPVRELFSAALVGGWQVTTTQAEDGWVLVATGADGRGRPQQVTVNFTPTPAGGLSARARHRHAPQNPSRASVKRAIDALNAGQPVPEEVREHGITGPAARALLSSGQRPDRPDDGCVCCQVTSPPTAGLTLTGTGLCAPCASWHRRAADTLPDPRCPHAPPELPGSWPWPDTWRHRRREPWRFDPRAEVCDDDGPTLQAWAATRGADLNVGATGGGVAMWLGDTEPDPVIWHDFDTGGWTAEHGRASIPLLEPARHELLEILTALDAGEPIPEHLRR